ncbi:glycoside hydrolase domain-containing protein [Kutzneria albida]|uniref:Rv2525c-like glycoside hydrolase-like domain-containing protein n=1 Tax=Kutzneria albida DSM 43870 TaxID=1449976 RepID=W5W1K9_9PSEU|nr:glycoside hydrolase domain-containing protein [Kutzneria albida]AHH94712.1 hypothetical protein KALB_1339 [Kutzneria albida DSM 43870]
MPTVIAYGADYSAGEFSPAQLDAYTAGGGWDLRVLLRYIGYPQQPKCISHYPGAYQQHVAAGRTVVLLHEWDVDDTAGGWDAGVAQARLALNDANSIGYPADMPIFMCADDWLSKHGISVSTAMSYLDGAASVLGWNRTGAYGFSDFVHPAQDGGHARWFWLCGDEANVRDGIHLYQCNYSQFSHDGVGCDLNKVYVDPASFSEGDFLMALEPWKQERIFDRILSMSQGVDGQDFDGAQFAREESERRALADAVAKLSQQVQALSDKIDAMQQNK